MRQHTSRRAAASTPDYDYYRRLYAHTWKPGCKRVQWVLSLLAERGIPYEADGFMADSEAWATERPSARHIPDIRILAS